MIFKETSDAASHGTQEATLADTLSVSSTTPKSKSGQAQLLWPDNQLGLEATPQVLTPTPVRCIEKEPAATSSRDMIPDQKMDPKLDGDTNEKATKKDKVAGLALAMGYPLHEILEGLAYCEEVNIDLDNLMDIMEKSRKKTADHIMETPKPCREGHVQDC